MERLVIIGAGGMAREVVSLVDAINAETPKFDLLGALDDGSPNEEGWNAIGVALLGPVSMMKDLDAKFVIAIGDGKVRRKIARALIDDGCRPATLLHPNLQTGRLVRIGAGSVVAGNVSITTNVTVGDHVFINIGCVIGHDAEISDFVTLMPRVTVCGETFLEEAATLGVNSVVLQSLRIGESAFLGAGAVAVRDVAGGTIAVGVPARSR